VVPPQARRVESQGFEVTAEPNGIARAVQQLGIPGEELLEIAIQPGLPGDAGEPECRLGIATPERKPDVASEVRDVRRETESVDPAFRQSVDERRAGRAGQELANGEPVHAQADNPSCARPEFVVQVSAHAAREEKPPRSRVIIDCALDGAEHSGDGLPLVQQDRFPLRGQRCIGVGTKRRGFGFSVQPDKGAGVAASCGRFTGRSGAGDKQCRELIEKPVVKLYQEVLLQVFPLARSLQNFQIFIVLKF